MSDLISIWGDTSIQEKLEGSNIPSVFQSISKTNVRRAFCAVHAIRDVFDNLLCMLVSADRDRFTLKTDINHIFKTNVDGPQKKKLGFESELGTKPCSVNVV